METEFTERTEFAEPEGFPEPFYPEFLSGGTRTKWGIERDSQRERVYRSERPLRNHTYNFPSVRTAQTFINTVTASRFWRRMRGIKHITLVSVPQRVVYCSAFKDKAEIRIAEPWGLNKLVLVHELTHFLVRAPHAHHGKLFCRLFLHLILLTCGRSLFNLMQDRFIANNVSY